MVLKISPKVKNMFPTSSARNVGMTGQREIPSGWVKDKKYTVSYAACAFKTIYPATNEVIIRVNNIEVEGAVTVGFYLPIQNLPDGAKILSGIVYGTAPGETWRLQRIDPSTGAAGGEIILETDVDSEDTTPAAGKEIIDNNTYAYFINVSPCDVGEKIEGAKISFIFEDPEVLD